jgi:ribonuclease P protein component
MYQFPQKEKLKSKKTIESLFSSGKSISKFPLLVFYRFDPSQDSAICKMTVAVSKKKHKRAVDRNLIKRRIKESYRLQKFALINQLKSHDLNLVFVYTAKEVLSFDKIFSSTEKLIQKLIDK